MKGEIGKGIEKEAGKEMKMEKEMEQDVERVKKWNTGKGLEKWLKKDNLLILILTGVLLFIIALPTNKREDTGSSLGKPESTTREEKATENGTGLLTGSMTAEAGEESEEDYAARLEQRLQDTLSNMEGVGKVQVMITLKASSELVVEKEQPYTRSSTVEQDTQGGSRQVTQTQSEVNTVYKTNGSDSEPYVVKTLAPQIEGVVVVAQGAGNGTINRTIVELVQALFDIEAHKIKVVKMESTG